MKDLVKILILLFCLQLGSAFAQQPEVFWIERSPGKVNVCDQDTPSTVSILDSVDGLSSPLSLAIDTVNNKIFFTDETGGSIYTANLDGTGLVAINIAADNPKGIDVDLIHQKVYWSEGSFDRDIFRSNLDGSNIETVVNNAMTGGPFQLKVDPIGGKVYWVDPTNIQIKRANFDGSSEETILPSLGNPSGIALDTNAGKIYWSDTSFMEIKRADLDGSNQETVVSGVFANFISLDTTNNRVYWTETANNLIYKADYFSTPQTVPASGVSNPYGLQIYFWPTATPTPTATPIQPTPTPGPTPTATPAPLTPDTVITVPPEVEVQGKVVTFTFLEFSDIDDSFIRSFYLQAKKGKNGKKPKLTARYELEISNERTSDKKRYNSKKNTTTVKNLKPGTYSARYRATVYRKRTDKEISKAKAQGKSGFDAKFKKVGSTNYSPSASFTV